MSSPVSLFSLLLALLFGSAAGTSMRFHIQGGSHDSDKGGIRSLQLGWRPDRTQRFTAVFRGNLPYATRTASNQGDWNKLMGFTTNQIHKNSIRLGWRWRPDLNKVEVGYYGYIQGVRTMLPLTTVALETPIDVEIRLWKNGETVRAAAASHTEARSLGLSGFWPTTTWLLETAYFGGDETAPHDIDISITDLHQQ